MGAFIVNVNVRSQDRSAVEQAVAALNPKAAWVTDAKNGWVTVYDEEASTQDDRRIRKLSEHLSDTLRAPAVAFLVHDNDFVCYWLCDGGRVIDEFNSRPDDFGEKIGQAGRSADVEGKPEVLIKYCAEGKQPADVRRVLHDTEPVFVVAQLEELADLFGIDRQRATADFKYIGQEVDPAEFEATFVGEKKPVAGRRRRAKWPLLRGTEADADADEGPGDAPPPGAGARPADLAGRARANLLDLMQIAGLAANPAKADLLVQRLVQAASENDVAEIDKLVVAGADVNGTAVLKRPTGGHTFDLSRMMAGGMIPLPVTPLHAALGNKHVDATRRLIELGADLKANHEMSGTPVHAAALTGDVDLLRLVLDGGGDPNALNAQRKTPLQILQAVGQMFDQLRQPLDLGFDPGEAATEYARERLNTYLPAGGGVAACERLLRERGARE
jgi:hypothetical protein